MYICYVTYVVEILLKLVKFAYKNYKKKYIIGEVKYWISKSTVMVDRFLRHF